MFQGFSASVIYTVGLALIADTVPAEEVGSWYATGTSLIEPSFSDLASRMGFVFSGMNGGALMAPFVAGAIYDHAGYYAIWGVVLGVIAFDFVLRLVMIEKTTARKWLKETQDKRLGPGSNGEEAPLLSEETDAENANGTTAPHQSASSYGTSEVGERLNGSIRTETKHATWFRRHMPAMATLLTSPRILAAVYGCFTNNALTAAFDAVLALFVKRTFHWSSTGAGLIFLAITVPSSLGALIGYLSDRFGNRSVALFGFGLTVPSLALLGVVTENTIAHQAALVVLLVANGQSYELTSGQNLLVPVANLLGIGLNFMIAPLAADMVAEVEILAQANPSVFGEKGGYAQVFSLFDAAFGLSTAVGPVWAGAFYEGTNWQIMAVSLALLSLLGGLPVVWFTGGKRAKIT